MKFCGQMKAKKKKKEKITMKEFTKYNKKNRMKNSYKYGRRQIKKRLRIKSNVRIIIQIE